MHKLLLPILIFLLAPLNVSAQGVFDPGQLPANISDLDDEAKQKIHEEAVRQNLGLARYDVSEFFRKDIPIDKPHLPRSYINAWASLAVSDIMTFGFDDHKERMNYASEYFTNEGWESFSQALQRSRIIEMVETNQQKIKAAPKGAPVLQSETVVGGVFQWILEIPLVLTYKSGQKLSHKNLLVTVIIARSQEERYPYGLAIKQWIAIAR